MKVPKAPPAFAKLLEQVTKNNPELIFRRMTDAAVREVIDRANDEAWNWEDCRYRAPGGLSGDEFWLLVKLSRMSDRENVPLRDKCGKPFTYWVPASVHRVFHLIDKYLGGTVESSFPQIDTAADRTRYLITSLTEEAIASSQIEGAVVTREQAKQMLKERRAPVTRDERMIFNNYQTIQMLNRRRNEPLSVNLLLEIQRSLTEGTLDTEDGAGRLRRPDEDVAVWDDENQEPLHVPPSAHELSERLAQLCAFANAGGGPAKAGEFIHPVIRAIVLHFWIGYDHPFVDGNGRTARALFYWSMLRSGYWLVEYLTISSVINRQRKQYARAYLNTETDGNDLTYFLVYHLRVVEESIEAFRGYLERKLGERRQQAGVLVAARFNPRQQALLLKALREPAARYTYESHASSHGVTLATGRADILELERLGLLRGNRRGRKFEFVPAPDIEAKLRKLAAS